MRWVLSIRSWTDEGRNLGLGCAFALCLLRLHSATGVAPRDSAGEQGRDQRNALEDETGIANLAVWPQVFEKNRRIILSAGMFAVRGQVQRGEVVHLVA